MKKAIFILSIVALVAFIGAPVVADVYPTTINDAVMLDNTIDGQVMAADSASNKSSDSKSCGKIEKKDCSKAEKTKPCNKSEVTEPNENY